MGDVYKRRILDEIFCPIFWMIFYVLPPIKVHYISILVSHLIVISMLSTLIDKFLHKLKLDPVRVFDICSEMRSDSK